MWRKNTSNEFLKKDWSLEQAKEKMTTFCAYQERCLWDARRKLNEKGIKKDEDQDEILDFLIEDGYIDEERFVMSFCRGKFNMKKWGKGRIRRELAFRDISKSLIEKGLMEIDEVAYYDSLLNQVEKKWEQSKESDSFKKRFKIVGYLMQKGYEKDLIEEAIENIISED